MGWIKCRTEMPPKCKTVLVWYNNDYEFGMTFGGTKIAIYEDGWQGNKVDAIEKDLSWMPLWMPPQD